MAPMTFIYCFLYLSITQVLCVNSFNFLYWSEVLPIKGKMSNSLRIIGGPTVHGFRKTYNLHNLPTFSTSLRSEPLAAQMSFFNAKTLYLRMHCKSVV